MNKFQRTKALTDDFSDNDDFRRGNSSDVEDDNFKNA